MRKTIILLSSLFVGASFIFLSTPNNPANAFSGGSPGGANSNTGLANNTCGNSGCHNTMETTVNGLVTTNIPTTGYKADSTYDITIMASQAGIDKWGFEISAENNAGSTQLGTFATTNAEAQVLSGGNATHTSSGNAGSGSKTWNLRWTAPNAVNAQDVTFRVAVIAANNNGNNSGDDLSVSETAVVFDNSTSSISRISKDDLNIYPNPAQNIIKIVNSQSTIEKVEIFNINGQMVKALNLVSENIEISDLEKGVYFVTISSNGEKITKKLLKL